MVLKSKVSSSMIAKPSKIVFSNTRRARLRNPGRSASGTSFTQPCQKTTNTKTDIGTRFVNTKTMINTARKKEPLPPLPPSPSPVAAKQMYLESKKRTEQFLQDPQKKILELQKEMDQVKDRLDKEVYNKSAWRRLTDPLKHKQHSVINMLAATFAYILAYQLHLKRQANQKLEKQLGEYQEELERTHDLLRSLLERQFVRELAQVAVEELLESAEDVSNTKSRGLMRRIAPAPSSTIHSTSDDCLRTKDVADALRKKLEERIGDEGLNEDAKKQKDIERIWKDNQKQLKQQEQIENLQGFVEVDSAEVNELLALTDETKFEQSGKRNISTKHRRVFDM